MAISGADPALTDARSGLARAGATRAGALTVYNLRVLLYRSVVDGNGAVTDILPIELTAYVLAGSLTISYKLNDDIDRATFTMKPSAGAREIVLRAGEVIAITLGHSTNQLFVGQAMQVVTRHQPGIQEPWYDVLCVDWLDLFDARLITDAFTNQSATAILTELLERYTPHFWNLEAGVPHTQPTFFTTGIQPNMPVIESLPITNQRLSTIFRNVTTALGGGFYIEPNRVVRAWAKGGEPPLSQPQPLLYGLPTLHQYAVTEDATQIRTRIIVEGQRTSTPLAIPRGGAGPSPAELESLPVEDASFFVTNAGADMPLRIGTQAALYRDKDRATDPTLNPSGATVQVGAAPGDTELRVTDIQPFIVHAVNQAGWVKVDDQVLRYTGADGTANNARLTGIPAAGYGSIQAAIADGASVSACPFLYDVDVWRDPQLPAVNVKPYHAQSPGTPVVMVVRQTNDGGVLYWKRFCPVGDGVREQIVQDGRLSYAGATQRATSELQLFHTQIRTATWETDDMNAMVGRVQLVNLWAVPQEELLITDVTLTFPLLNKPPRRQCSGSTLRTATLLDVVLTDLS